MFVLQESGWGRRVHGRRWTSLKQHNRAGDQNLSGTGKDSVPSTPSTATASPLAAGAAMEGHRKSNWQVIEHFSSNKDKGSLSSSLIAVSNHQTVNV